MKARAALVGLWLAACSGGDPIPSEAWSLRIQTGVEFVEFGRGFPLAVVRVWANGVTPAAFEDRLLAPLVVQLLAVEQRSDGRRQQETRRYRAHAFAPDRIVLAPVTLAATDAAGASLLARSDELVLRVAPALGPEHGPAPEIPSDLLPIPRRGTPWPWLLGAGVALAVMLGWHWRRTVQPVAAPPSAAPAPAPSALALASLEALRAQQPVGHAETQAFFVTACAVLRDFVRARHGVDAHRATTESTLAALQRPGRLQDAALQPLAACLRLGDLVKFARWQPDADQRRQWLDMAVRFVRADGAEAGGA